MGGRIENAQERDFIAAAHERMRFAHWRIAEQKAPISRGEIAAVIALDGVGPKVGINSILGPRNLQVAINDRPPIFRMGRELLRLGRRRRETKRRRRQGASAFQGGTIWRVVHYAILYSEGAKASRS